MDGHERDVALNLLDLPSKALVLVARQSTRVLGHGHPMLSVSTGARDAVLNGLTKLRLDLERGDTASSVQALARLLDRACRQAPPGLAVFLHAWEQPGGEEESVLEVLLQPTFTGGSWVNVHTLDLIGWEARVDALGPVLSSRLTAAFPNLRTLSLAGVTIQGDSFFTSLLSLPHLHTISLCGDIMADAAACSALQELSGLAPLQAFELSLSRNSPYMPLPALAPLTQLTELTIHRRYEPLQQVASHLQNLQQLQTLIYSGVQSGWRPVEPVGLQQLLATLPQLTRLSLGLAALDQPALEVLMQHGTRLTHLFAGTIATPDQQRTEDCIDAQLLQRLLTSCPLLAELGFSRADVDQAGLDVLLAHTQLTYLAVQSITPAAHQAGITPTPHAGPAPPAPSASPAPHAPQAGIPCSWRKLVLHGQPRFGQLRLRDLPLLPLPSESLVFSGQLQLPVREVALGALPALVHQAATHLGRCKQVVCKPQLTDGVLRHGSDDNEGGLGAADHDSFSPEQRTQLLEALAPMAAHVTQLEINIGRGWAMGRAEVEALGRAVGGRLEHLTLKCGRLEPDFWPAVLSASSPLPLLTVLRLGGIVQGAVQGADLALVCSQAQRRLTLKLQSGLYTAAGEQLQVGGQGHGLVIIKSWDGWR